MNKLETPACCTEGGAGARNVDHILAGTLLSEIADAVPARMAGGSGIARIEAGASRQGQFRYTIR